MAATTATNFRSNVKKYLDLVINDSQEVIISRGSDSAVLIPSDQYNSIKETEYLMSSKEIEEVIVKGMEDVKNGNFREHPFAGTGRILQFIPKITRASAMKLWA